jgi:hypothetical protein
LFTEIVFSGWYESRTSSMCNPVTSSIFLITLFLNTLSLRSFPNTIDQVSYPYKNNRYSYSSSKYRHCKCCVHSSDNKHV